MRKIKLAKIFCLFGKHRQSKKPIELKPEKNSVMEMELFFCVCCKKILFIGYQRPTHPQCLCSLFYDIKMDDKSKEFLTGGERNDGEKG